MDNYLYKMGGLSSKVSIALLPKFKISNAETFDGIGDPKPHGRRYISIAESLNLEIGRAHV